MAEITLRQSGGSLTAVIPESVADKYNLQPGDRMSIIEVEDCLLLTPHDPDFAEAMEAYKKGTGKYRNALRELAK